MLCTAAINTSNTTRTQTGEGPSGGSRAAAAVADGCREVV